MYVTEHFGSFVIPWYNVTSAKVKERATYLARPTPANLSKLAKHRHSEKLSVA